MQECLSGREDGLACGVHTARNGFPHAPEGPLLCSSHRSTSCVDEEVGNLEPISPLKGGAAPRRKGDRGLMMELATAPPGKHKVVTLIAGTKKKKKHLEVELHQGIPFARSLLEKNRMGWYSGPLLVGSRGDCRCSLCPALGAWTLSGREARCPSLYSKSVREKTFVILDYSQPSMCCSYS